MEPAPRRHSDSLARFVRSHPALAACLLGTLVLLLAHAFYYWFLTDDAYISFRYARNLARGDGLVFNPGFERVEGYTNFLWVLVLAAFDAVGLAPERVSNALSLALTAVLWALVAWFAMRSTQAGERAWLVVVPTLLLAATRSVAVWSTSGLETRLFEVLTVAAVFRLVVEVEATVREDERTLPLSGVLFALATLTRPDGQLVFASCFAAAALYLALRRKLAWRLLAANALGYAGLVGAHYAFRLAYYREWLPNTYYAKVDGRTWWDMGFRYLAAFGLEYAAFLWIPLLIAAFVYHVRRGSLSVPLLFAAAVIPHAVYAASIGGDHFEYRPLDLYFPFAFLLVCDGARLVARSARGAALVAAYLGLVLFGLLAIPVESHRQFPDHYVGGFPGQATTAEALTYLGPDGSLLLSMPGIRDVAAVHAGLLRSMTERLVGIRQEEHKYFCAETEDEGRRLRTLAEAGEIPRDTYLCLPCVGAIGYFSNLRILDRLGLTDAYVARQPSDGPRIQAHDKNAPWPYVVRSGVDILPVGTFRVSFPAADPALLAAISKTNQAGVETYVADLDDGTRVMGVLPQGPEAAALRFGRSFFRTNDPAVLRALRAGSPLR